MSNAQFKANFAKLLANAGKKAELVVRQTAVALQSGMVDKAPVGDPSQWLSLRPFSDIATQKQGTMLKAPEGYVGGRFKNNFQCGISSINTDTSAEPDKSGDGSISRTLAALESWKVGQTIYMTNSLPYSKRLEYGWSQQAPAGMVRLTVQDYSRTLRQIVAGIK